MEAAVCVIMCNGNKFSEAYQFEGLVEEEEENPPGAFKPAKH